MGRRQFVFSMWVRMMRPGCRANEDELAGGVGDDYKLPEALENGTTGKLSENERGYW